MAPLPRVADRAPRPATGELAKATIIDTTTGVGLAVMYNPEELKFDQGNVFAEVAIPGLNAPPVQYVRGRSRTLSMELFFDTYETARDVREHTAPLTALLERRPQTLAPPVLIFSLGRVQFRCVLVEAGLRFTMFLRDGTPVRSTMSVRFQEYVDIGIDIQQGLFLGSPTVSAAINTTADLVVAAATGSGSVHVTVDGETLSGLAAIYLGDAARWRTIAQANRIDDPFDLPAGTALVIPPAGGAR